MDAIPTMLAPYDNYFDRRCETRFYDRHFSSWNQIINSATKKDYLAFKITVYYSLCYCFTVKQVQITKEAPARGKERKKLGSEPPHKKKKSP